MLLTVPGPGSAAPDKSAGDLILAARQDLARDDGIAAQVRLKQAMAQGATRKTVAAYMGQALLAQDEPDEARKWLAGGEFSPASAAYGFRALARLEREEGHLPAAGKAFDRAIALTPDDAAMWVEIGRLRYAGGEHLLAIEAADHAVQLDPRNVRALEFKGQIVRDRHGLAGALPWFEAALLQAPGDVSVLGEYAATLGELDRARDMLVVTRKMLEIEPGNPRAYYLQAVMAARAGEYRLARVLLGKTRDKLKALPGAILLEGVLELKADNPALAVEAFERLVRLRPADARARDLLARAIFESGEYDYLVERFGRAASDPGASVYLQTLVGRTYENLDRRDLAASLLDFAARRRTPHIRPTGSGSAVAVLIAQRRAGEAQAMASAAASADPGFYDNLSLAGDAQLAAGNGESAAAYYAQASRIRLPESLLTRRVEALLAARRPADAAGLANAYLYYNPTSRTAIGLVAGMAARAGDWKRAAALYGHLVASGGGQDARLLADLAYAQMGAGNAALAEGTAQRAYRLQRSSAVTTQAWGLALATLGKRREAASALLAKARAISGDNPSLARARLRLAGLPDS
ncbi:MAG TPA: tetratricopeptide repeat protein [Novosphingobium sp.]|nr:tetratricopeptide repeat protein [Novosphingobium sp.]